VAAFHPELTTDRRLHARFASMVMRRGVQAA
jgi:glutamine amidotransferase PdxT